MILLAGLFLTAILGANAQASPPSVPSDASLDTLTQKVEAATRGIDDLRARFSRRKVFTVFNTTEDASGEIFYKRPDLFILHEKEPEELITWVKGGELAVYEKAVNQLRKQKLSDEDRQMLFLAARFDRKALEEHFAVNLKQVVERAGEKLFIVDLTPKSEDLAAELDRIEVTISSANWLVKQVSVYETNKDVTHMKFTDVRLNTGIDQSPDLPKVPSGAQVIDLTR